MVVRLIHIDAWENGAKRIDGHWQGCRRTLFTSTSLMGSTSPLGCSLSRQSFRLQRHSNHWFGTRTEIYAPAGIGNGEHALVRNAVLAIRPDATLYADLPYALKTELGGFNLPSDANAGERLGVDVSLDAATLNAKLEAVGEYRTQLAQLVRYFGDFLNTDGLGRERFWRAVGS